MTTILAAQSSASSPNLDVGGVVGAVWRVVTRRGLDLLIVATPFVILPQVIAGCLPQSLSVLKLAFGLPSIVFTGAGSLIAYAELSGSRRISVRDAIPQGFRGFGSLWGVGFISNVAIGVGTILLVVPGVVAMVGWIPASATVVIENTTAMDALGRAWRRTQGVRWRLALLSLLVLVVAALSLVAITALDIALIGAFGVPTMRTVSNLVTGPLYTFEIVALMTAFSTAVYAALRPAAAQKAVADVFS